MGGSDVRKWATELVVGMERAAIRYNQLGFSTIPITLSSKIPAIKWREFQDRRATQQEIKSWPKPYNVGIVTGELSGVVVVDCDSIDSYLGWLATKPRTPFMVKTRSGMHFYYRHPGEYVKSNSHIKDKAGFEYDVKGDCSYAMAPPAFRGSTQYRIMPQMGNMSALPIIGSRLPKFEMEWRPETVAKNSYVNSAEVRDGVAYIRKIFAVEGQAGDKNTFRAACKLHASGMDEVSAIAAMLEWNESNASPPWKPAEIIYKVRRAYSGE